MEDSIAKVLSLLFLFLRRFAAFTGRSTYSSVEYIDATARSGLITLLNNDVFLIMGDVHSRGIIIQLCSNTMKNMKGLTISQFVSKYGKVSQLKDKLLIYFNYFFYFFYVSQLLRKEYYLSGIGKILQIKSRNCRPSSRFLISTEDLMARILGRRRGKLLNARTDRLNRTSIFYIIT